jgi:hypothetical protein
MLGEKNPPRSPRRASLNFGYVESIVECDALILLLANS